MVEVSMCEDNSCRYDVENLQALEQLWGITAGVNDHTLFLARRNHICICIEWAYDDALNHVT